MKRDFWVIKAELDHVERLRSQVRWSDSMEVYDELAKKAGELHNEMLRAMMR